MIRNILLRRIKFNVRTTIPRYVSYMRSTRRTRWYHYHTVKNWELDLIASSLGLLATLTAVYFVMPKIDTPNPVKRRINGSKQISNNNPDKQQLQLGNKSEKDIRNIKDTSSQEDGKPQQHIELEEIIVPGDINILNPHRTPPHIGDDAPAQSDKNDVVESVTPSEIPNLVPEVLNEEDEIDLDLETDALEIEDIFPDVETSVPENSRDLSLAKDGLEVNTYLSDDTVQEPKIEKETSEQLDNLPESSNVEINQPNVISETVVEMSNLTDTIENKDNQNVELDTTVSDSSIEDIQRDTTCDYSLKEQIAEGDDDKPQNISAESKEEVIPIDISSLIQDEDVKSKVDKISETKHIEINPTTSIPIVDMDEAVDIPLQEIPFTVSTEQLPQILPENILEPLITNNLNDKLERDDNSRNESLQENENPLGNNILKSNDIPSKNQESVDNELIKDTPVNIDTAEEADKPEEIITNNENSLENNSTDLELEEELLPLEAEIEVPLIEVQEIPSIIEPFESLKDNNITKEVTENPETLIEDPKPLNEEQIIYNPDTGEINWDSPSLRGLAQGPCGEEFKVAFSCFVYSEREPRKGQCINQFQGMQSCFQRHPDYYLNNEEGQSLKASPEVNEDETII